MRKTDLRTRLYSIAAIVLVVGAAWSLFIYRSAGDIDTDSLLGNQLDESKSYRRSLEMYGGKANLLASEFTQWFGTLWHGRQRGITLAWITVAVCLALVLTAGSLPRDPD